MHALRAFGFLGRFRQRRDDFKKIADHTEVSDAEDRCVGVFVDGNDAVRVAHAGQMLDGAGDAVKLSKSK